jgi:pimeloyl-ACP methyl ester carboxylesterase
MVMANRLCVFMVSLFILCAGGAAHSQDKNQRAEKISARPIQLETKAGKIDGTLDLPAGAGPFPVVIIITGSGPIDRDGNAPGVKNDSLKQLGQGLAGKGIAALRYDRPGVGKSAAIGPKEVDYRFEMLVEDVVGWIKLLRKDTRFSHVGVVGHSQGSLVGMIAARQGKADAFVALAGCGRPTAEVLRWQFGKNLPTRALKDRGNQVIDELVAGRTVADIPKGLEDIRPSVQPFLISLFKYDPAREIARLEVPVMIVQGTTDLQTPVEEAKILAKAKKDAQLCIIESMNHTLKKTTATSAFWQWSAYNDPSIPLAPMLVENVSAFLTKSLARGEPLKPRSPEKSP